MEIRDLMYFKSLVAAGNFTRAARALGIEPSTISRRIGRFEDDLGLALFERGREGIRLTSGGKAVLPHIRRALAELDAIKQTGNRRGNGTVGEVRLAARIPPIGKPLHDILVRWRNRNPEVLLTIWEMSEWEIQTAIYERRIDVALMTRHTLWQGAASAPLYRERLFVAMPCGHPLLRKKTLNWKALRSETLLIQGWDDSQSTREFCTSLMDCDVHFHAHAAGDHCILALVSAGYGITLATRSQSKVSFPGVVYRPICEANAWVQVELAWSPAMEDPTVGRFVAFMRDEARLNVPLL